MAGNVQLPAVVSMSLGASGVDTTMDAAVQAVLALGVPVVAAAGNYNSGALCSWLGISRAAVLSTLRRPVPFEVHARWLP